MLRVQLRGYLLHCALQRQHLVPTAIAATASAAQSWHRNRSATTDTHHWHSNRRHHNKRNPKCRGSEQQQPRR